MDLQFLSFFVEFKVTIFGRRKVQKAHVVALTVHQNGCEIISIPQALDYKVVGQESFDLTLFHFPELASYDIQFCDCIVLC